MRKRLLLAAWIICMIVPGLASAPKSDHSHQQPFSLPSDEYPREMLHEKENVEPRFTYLEGKIPEHRLEHYRRLFHPSPKNEALPDQQFMRSQERVNMDSIYEYMSDQLVSKTYNQFDSEGNHIIMEIYMQDTYQYEPFDIPIIIGEYSYNSQGQQTLSRALYINHSSLPEIEYIVDYEYEYDYDLAERQTFYSYKYYDYNAGEMVNGQRWYREYEDAFNREIYFLRQNGSGQNWINNYLLERTLFADGTTDMVYYKSANAQGDWSSGMKYDYISWYNTQRYEDVYGYSYFADDESWHPMWRFFVIINDQGLTDFFYEFHYHEESWWERFRRTYHYDENNMQTYTLEETRPTPEADYENCRMWTFENNESGIIIHTLVQNWNTDDEIWVNYQQTQYEFDHPAGFTYYLLQSWNTPEQVWENILREIRDYDDANNTIYHHQQYWSTSYQRWYSDFEITWQYNALNFRVLEERKSNQNPETLLWTGWCVKLVSDYDSYGLLYERDYYNWNHDMQEFELGNTRLYTHDYYGNRKKLQDIDHYYPEYSLEQFGYATYPVTLAIHSQGQPLEGAVLSIMGTNFTSDSQGMIAFNPTLDHEMVFNYTLEAEGYNTRQGQLKIDRKLDMEFNMVAEGTATYNVSFLVKKGDIPIEDAAVYLTGYGMQHTCDEGMTTFEDVVPEVNISYAVTYGGMTYEGTITVTDHNMTVEVDLDEITSVVLADLPQVHIYPNPVSHILQLSLKGLPLSTVSIFDMSGRKVFEQEFTEGVHMLDASFLHKGAYVVVIGHGDFRKVIKLLKR